MDITPGKAVRVLLADDHAAVRRGVRDFLTEDETIEIIAEADDGAEAWAKMTRCLPDVAVLDIQMSGLSGVELTKRIKEYYPEVRVLVLTAYDDEPYIFALLRAGADGYIMKTARGSELRQAVKNVARGKSVLDPEVAAKVIANATDPRHVEPLSERELDVLRGVAKSQTNRQIGQVLAISDRTVQGHLANIFSKLQVSSRTEAVTLALQQGMITLEETRS